MIDKYSDVLGSGARAPEPNTTISATNISKRFGATQALDNVSVELLKGEVHAFAGENGAGKSTLGKIISGLYTADSGNLYLDGNQVTKWDTGKAQKSGVVLIAQELSLVPKLSVANNVFLGVESNKFGILKNDYIERYEQLDEITKFGLNPYAQVDSLRLADRQKVEILRALARDARVIIMDEPTSSLTSDEVEKLHAVIKQLSEQGRSIVYVTHFLEALLDTAHRVSVLRDGKLVRTSDTLDETKQSLVEAMIGRSFESAFPVRLARPADDIKPRLKVVGLSGENGTKNISFELKPGEIVGFAGLVGSGRSEIAKLLFGIDRITEGKIYLNDEELTAFSPQKNISRGIVLVPEDRRSEGLVLGRSVKENISLPHLNQISKSGVINRLREMKTVKTLAEKVKVNPPRINAAVADFSGGNQQKVLIGKWIYGDPSIIILDEPTRGVDIGAKSNIYETIIELAKKGASVLLISSEHEEVMALSNRVYLVRNNQIIGEIDPREKSIDDVLFALFDVTEEEKTGKVTSR